MAEMIICPSCQGTGDTGPTQCGCCGNPLEWCYYGPTSPGTVYSYPNCPTCNGRGRIEKKDEVSSD